MESSTASGNMVKNYCFRKYVTSVIFKLMIEIPIYEILYVVNLVCFICLARQQYAKQGRISSYPSRMWVGRGSAGEGHYSIWAGAMGSKSSETPKKLNGDHRRTNIAG